MRARYLLLAVGILGGLRVYDDAIAMGSEPGQKFREGARDLRPAWTGDNGGDFRRGFRMGL